MPSGMCLIVGECAARCSLIYVCLIFFRCFFVFFFFVAILSYRFFFLIFRAYFLVLQQIDGESFCLTDTETARVGVSKKLFFLSFCLSAVLFFFFEK